jgi:very-short-patch-repair endonuclease
VLDRAVEQSMILQLYDDTALLAVLERAGGRRGAAALRSLIEDLPDEPVRARSELERRFLDLVRAAGLPAPIVNALVCGYEVDFHWPRQRLIVETDGRSVHGTPIAFDRDRRRDLDLELTGWHVLRLSWRQVVESPEHVTAALRRRLRS